MSSITKSIQNEYVLLMENAFSENYGCNQSCIGKPGQWALYNRFFNTQDLADTVVLHDVISFEQIFSQPFRRLW